MHACMHACGASQPSARIPHLSAWLRASFSLVARLCFLATAEDAVLMAALQGLSLCMGFAGLWPVGGVVVLLMAVARLGFLAALPAGELSHPGRADFLAPSVCLAGCILEGLHNVLAFRFLCVVGGAPAPMH